MEELSYAVGYNYLIVKNIIKHMSWREAAVAEKVCVLWQAVVKELRRTELHVQQLRFSYINDGHPVTFVTDPECFGVPEVLITLRRQFEDSEPFRCPLNPCPKTINRWSRVCPHCTEDALFKHACSFCNRDTKVISIMSSGILHLQKQERKGNFMGGLMIPKIPGVQVDLLNISSQNYSDPSNFFLELNEIMDNNIVKCLLIYMKLDYCFEKEVAFVEKLMDTTRTRQERTHPTCPIAIFGGITHNSTEFRALFDHRENITKVLLFSVKKSDIDSVEYSAFSSVFSFNSLSNRITIINSFRDHIKMISDRIPRRKYGVIIKISCWEKSIDSSFEDDILAEHFHNMPIVIFESGFRIGVNCLPILSNESPDTKKAPRDMYDYVHNSSTVMLIMSWGRLL